MTQTIRQAAVLGAGVMGSAIAAHLANAGIKTILLDIVPPDLPEAERGNRAARCRIAQAGLDRALKAKPALFFHPSHGALVSVGNVDDDLGKLAECDIVIEAAPEVIGIKRALFDKIEKSVRPNTIVSSNTSGLPIRDLLEGRGQDFRQHFIVTHFFNPVRYMKLLELVPGPETLPEVFMSVLSFGRDVLGKGIVVGRDTPNFVGNRIGVFAMQIAILEMLRAKLAPEEVDAVAGPPLGRPRSAAFRTGDLVGIDTLTHVTDNCYRLLSSDPEREVFAVPDFIRKMVERKQLGDKTGGGFYKKEGKAIRTLDPYTGEYRDKLDKSEVLAFCKSLKDVEDPRERARRLIADGGPAGRFAWTITARTLLYAGTLVGEICDDIVAIDEAMKWGYNWEIGPFELWDALGFRATVDRMVREGMTVPKRIQAMREKGTESFYFANDEIYDVPKGAPKLHVTDSRYRPFAAMRGDKAVARTDGASLWDTGDGVFAVSFTTKANSIDADVVAMIEAGVHKAEDEGRALILFNEGEHFSVGANLMLVVQAAMNKDFEAIRTLARRLQGASQMMKYARVPVVAAPFGMTVGGGLEVCLGAGHVQAAAETYAGLVEVGVGLIPAGGGCLNALWRALEDIPEAAAIDVTGLTTQVFKNIALAKVATSAIEAKHVGYFKPSDGVTFDKARLLHDTRKHAIGLAERGYHPPVPRTYKLLGESGIATFQMMVDALTAGGQATPHDGVVARRLADVLCGGIDGAVAPVTEQRMLELEVEAFLSLCGEPKTLERMQYMLMNNKPLRN
jgi:3-hydroxyacyl-CoA dehydrogenase